MRFRSLGLAPIVDQLYEKVAELHRPGVSMLQIEQNVERRVARAADRAYVLEQGAVTLRSPSDELGDNWRVRALHVGETKGGR